MNIIIDPAIGINPIRSFNIAIHVQVISCKSSISYSDQNKVARADT